MRRQLLICLLSRARPGCADESETQCARNGPRPLLRIELDEDALDMRFDGLGRDGKHSRDFLVDAPLGNQMEDVALTAAERLRNCARRTRSELRLMARTRQEGRCD